MRRSRLFVLVPMTLACLVPSHCHAQDKILWPVPGVTDIRGTYCDYRDSAEIDYPFFHGGIDIHSAAGTWVYPPVDEVEVAIVDPPDAPVGGEVSLYLNDNDPMSVEAFRYGHVTNVDPFGIEIVTGRTFDRDDAMTTIHDWQGGGGDLDHLHFDIQAQRRNPLWVGDNPHREVDVPVAPGRPEIRAVAIGPYDEDDGELDDCGVLHGDSLKTFDGQDVDIIVYAHGPGSQVGVRGLAYCVLDEDGGAPSEFEWRHFCDFTEAPPSGGEDEAKLVYAFGNSFENYLCGYPDMTQRAPPSDAMWYIVTNSTGAANSFADSSWRPPDVLGGETEVIQELWIKAWASAGPNNSNNVTTVKFLVKVLPNSNPAANAALLVESAGSGVDVSWERFGGPKATQYEIWLVCPEGSERRVAVATASDECESGSQPYHVTIDGNTPDEDCVYRYGYRTPPRSKRRAGRSLREQNP